MDVYPLQSRESETQQIVRNSLRNLELLLKHRNPALFREALLVSGLTEDPGLSLDCFDKILAYIRGHVPSITLELFSTLSIMDLGLVGYAAASANNVGEALRIINNYHELTSDRFRPLMEVTRYEVSVITVANDGYENRELSDIAEDHLAGTWNILRQLLGTKGKAKDIQVRFSYSAPLHSAFYFDIFGANVEFNAAITELVFPREWLDRPLNISSPETSRFLQQICERILGGEQRERDTRGAVRMLLLTRQGRTIPGVEEAARGLNLSTEQLRKRLWRQGTSYKALVLETRMMLAKNYLEATGFSIQEIAYLLDYNQPAAFSRAFKSFTGVSPYKYRTSHNIEGLAIPANAEINRK